MTISFRPTLFGLMALALGACASDFDTATQTHPVFLLAQVKTDQEAWAAAEAQDQPVLMLANGVYGLSEPCVPQRYYAGAQGERDFGSGLDARAMGSAVGGRDLGSADAGRNLGAADAGRNLGAADAGRNLGSDADGRDFGTAVDGRNTGGADGGRALGGADAGRSLGGDSRGRAFGADANSRMLGATESVLRCQLGYDQATIVIYGASATGYLYSPRFKGTMEGIVFR
jgi:hypothetical protein